MSIIYIDSYRFAAATSYDPDAAAYIARVESASGDNAALETAVKDAINAFVVGCKADGIWNAIKASCILAGARTLNGALQPLVGSAPTNVSNLFVSGDYDRKTGLKGDGTSKYLNTGRARNAEPQYSYHLAVRKEDSLMASNPYYIGHGQSGSFGLLGQNGIYVDSGSFAPGSASLGLIGASRTSASNVFIKRPGALAVATAMIYVSSPSIDTFVFCWNSSGSPTAYTASRFSFYSIGESLDLALLDARVTTLINAFAAAIP